MSWHVRVEGPPDQHDHDIAVHILEAFPGAGPELDKTHPGAKGSLREGLDHQPMNQTLRHLAEALGPRPDRQQPQHGPSSRLLAEILWRQFDGGAVGRAVGGALPGVAVTRQLRLVAQVLLGDQALQRE